MFQKFNRKVRHSLSIVCYVLLHRITQSALFHPVRELSALHTKRLMVNFETDEAHQEREIDAKTREITDLFHHAENVLKRFGKQSEDTTLSVADRTVRKNMQMSMARKIQGLSMSFRSTQKVNPTSYVECDIIRIPLILFSCTLQYAPLLSNT